MYMPGAPELAQHHAISPFLEQDFQSPASSIVSTPCSGDSWDDNPTTLMLQNLPCMMRREQVVEAVDNLGFAGKYDLLYVPTGKRPAAGTRNLGYGFVNFLCSQDARDFASAFSGYHFAGSQSAKVCKAVPARLQGLKRNTQGPRGRHRRRGLVDQGKEPSSTVPPHCDSASLPTPDGQSRPAMGRARAEEVSPHRGPHFPNQAASARSSSTSETDMTVYWRMSI